MSKAIFFDIDGTLYAHKGHQIIPSSQIALKKLKEKGYPIVVATSRCIEETVHLPRFFHDFPFDGYIYDGGALMVKDGKVIQKKVIPVDAMKRIIAYCDEYHKVVRYANEKLDCFHFEPEASIKDVYFYLYLNIPKTKPYEGEEVTNCLLYIDPIEAEQLAKELTDCAFIHHEELYEITHKEVNKAHAVKEFARLLGCDEVIAFGDGFNDVQMLKEADLGIAMGNACEPCKQVADDVTSAVDQDGIYQACLKYQLFEEDGYENRK